LNQQRFRVSTIADKEVEIKCETGKIEKVKEERSVASDRNMLYDNLLGEMTGTKRNSKVKNFHNGDLEGKILERQCSSN